MKLTEEEQKVFDWLDKHANVKGRETYGGIVWDACITLCGLDMSETHKNEETAFNALFLRVWSWRESREFILSKC